MCSWFEGVRILGYLWLCVESGWPVSGAAIAAALITAISILWAIRGAAGVIQKLSATIVIASVFFLSVATGLPELQPQTDVPPGGRVAILIDSSESVRRDGDAALIAAREIVADRLQRMTEEAPPDADWTGSVIAFGAAPRILTQSAALRDLAANVAGAEIGPVANDSNIETALAAALRDISAGPGAGMVMLLSDGIQTKGDFSNAVESAQEVGIPIHILPLGSESPSKGLLSHNLGPDQAIGRPATLRATVHGDGELEWGINGTTEPAITIPDADLPKPVLWFH